MLPGYVDLPSSSRTSIRSAWLGTGAAAAVIVMLAHTLFFEGTLAATKDRAHAVLGGGSHPRRLGQPGHVPARAFW
jgi:hypothetical protein